MQKTFQMKNSLLFIFLILISNLTSAQDIFEKYQKNPEASYLSVSPKMFEMLGKLSINTGDANTDGFIEMIQNLKSFKVLSSKSKGIATDMESWVLSQLDQTDLETIMNISEKEVDVQFCAVYGPDNSKVERLVMFVKGAQKYADQEGLDLSNIDYILLSIEGNIDLNQIAILTEIVDVPGGNFLKELN